VGIRDWYRPRHQPVAQIDPDPLRTPEDAGETGLIIGMTGNQKTPWFGIVIKNLRDRRLAAGELDERRTKPFRVAGKSSGTVAGKPPTVNEEGEQ